MSQDIETFARLHQEIRRLLSLPLQSDAAGNNDPEEVCVSVPLFSCGLCGVERIGLPLVHLQEMHGYSDVDSSRLTTVVTGSDYSFSTNGKDKIVLEDVLNLDLKIGTLITLMEWVTLESLLQTPQGS